MTYKNKALAKKHNSLFVKIKRWQAQGKDVSELLTQLTQLKCQSLQKRTDEGLTKTPPPRERKKNNSVMNEILAKIEQLREEQKNLWSELISKKVNSQPHRRPTRKGEKLIFYVYE